MDKQARLASIMQSINELKQKEEQAIYGVELNTKSREWSFVATCAQKLINIDTLREDLTNEARQLQESIEQEAREELL